MIVEISQHSVESALTNSPSVSAGGKGFLATVVAGLLVVLMALWLAQDSSDGPTQAKRYFG